MASMNTTTAKQTSTNPAMKWDHAKATKASEKGSYLRVRNSGTSTSTSYRNLSGATKFWEAPQSSDPLEADCSNDVFVPYFRITGTDENIRIALQLAGVPIEEIQHGFDQGVINKLNFKSDGVQRLVKEDQERSRLFKERKKIDVSTRFLPSEVIFFHKNKKNARVVSQSSNKVKNAAVKPKSNKNDSIFSKLTTLEEGKYLDVSGMDSVTGKSTLVKAPSRTNKQSHYFSDFRIMSNDYDKLVKALRLLHGDNYATICREDLEKARSFFEARKKIPLFVGVEKAKLASDLKLPDGVKSTELFVTPKLQVPVVQQSTSSSLSMYQPPTQQSFGVGVQQSVQPESRGIPSQLQTGFVAPPQSFGSGFKPEIQKFNPSRNVSPNARQFVQPNLQSPPITRSLGFNHPQPLTSFAK